MWWANQYHFRIKTFPTNYLSFPQHSDIVPGDVGTGATVLALGIVLAIVMNELNRREYNKIMAYVTLKVEEMQQSANSRQRFNEDYAAGTVPANSQGPYGNQ